jgi:hypothetical protein
MNAIPFVANTCGPRKGAREMQSDPLRGPAK